MPAQYASTSTVRDDLPSAPPTAQQWAPPKNPLPPHRLARLANALGVSTPMPAIHTPSPLLSPSYNGTSSAADIFRRSPTPSSASSFGFSQSTSKYLLHVIPPIHLPHDTDSFDSELTPPPSTASGYHTQFRRGTLVPVHPTLQSQLGAIAREYALPSTSGLVLYLVSQPRSHSNHSSPPAGADDKSFADEMEEPGPRLSEDIWRHLWTRVVKTELREEGVSLAPPLLGLGISSMAGRSTSYLAHHHDTTAYPLPLLSTNQPQPSHSYPFTPSPTTPSSTSDQQRYNTKSAPPSSSSRSPSEAETPDTSQAASERADSLDLPGLNTNALIPILAKVEFDIDRRRAGWYEPWLRSRRLNHAKRAESVNGRKNSVNDSSVDEGERAFAPLAFRLNGRKQSDASAVSLLSSAAGSASASRARYLPLSESPNSMTGESDSDDDDDEMDAGKDPLADVFGTDADTWADMRAVRHPRPENPHVVQLALSPAELDDTPLEGRPEEEEEEGERSNDMREVVELMGRPQLGADIPGMHRSMSRKRAPPPTPLVLSPSSSYNSTPNVPPQPSPPEEDEELETPPDEGRTILPYLEGAESDGYSSTPPTDKRTGGIYDDMDLGFEVSDDFDDADPNDRRKSQVIMRAQLDEIEKNLAQFSPRILKTDLAEEQAMSLASAASSPHLSPPGSAQFPTRTMASSNADVFPPTPRLPNHPDVAPEEESDSDDLSQQAAWPAVPFTSLSERSLPVGERSPPRLAVNGVSASMPKRFRTSTASRSSTASSASETELRKRDLAEQQAAYPLPALSPPGAAYPAMTPSLVPKSSLNSPLIPLSPDPFGRHPSQVPPLPTGKGAARQSGAYWDAPVVIPAPAPPPTKEVQRKSSVASISDRTTSSSRFSTDSMHGDGTSAQAQTQKQTNRGTLMSVKSIKNLWRKSQKNSVSGVSVNTAHPISTVPENAYSPLSPPLPPQRPTRPSMEDMELPDVDVPPVPPRTPINGSFSFPSLPSSARPSPNPSPRPSPNPSPRPSHEQAQTHAQLGVPARRPSQERTQSQMSIQSQVSMQSQMSAQSQLSVPPPMMRTTNNAPIIAAKAGPPRKASMDGLHWDQESPYPTRAAPARAPSVTSSAPSRPTSRPPSTSSINPPPFTNTAPVAPPPSESHRNSVRKSILKWKSATNGAGAVPAPLTPSATTFRTRKTSITGSPSQGSPLTLPLDIPPSPKIPEQFINSYVGSHPPAARPNSAAIARRRLSAKMASTSTDASSTRRHRTQGSMASSSHSHGSEETRDTHESTSLDTSGFEIVSPRMGGTLSFPYHDLDHDQPVDGVRM
ncbi:hypothetical protein C8R43DRAFT_1013355 [Mycena crocata]|nr:hypothetical protein C8R43DRAFT_1013355 [Mycena crocata]